MEQLTVFLTSQGELVLFTAIFLAVSLLTFAFGSMTVTRSEVRRRVAAGGGASADALRRAVHANIVGAAHVSWRAIAFYV